MLNIFDTLLIFLSTFIILLSFVLFYIKIEYPTSKIADIFRIKRKSKEENKVRVRFAPSPTGFLHIGNIRTLLFNYFFAANMKGSLILRIEDTDEKRYDSRAIKYLKDVCKWLKIEFEEDPYKGGPYAPYIQSQRADIYKKYVSYLIEKGYAYRAFESVEELDALKQKYSKFSYNNITRYMVDTKNELNMKPKEIKDALASGIDFVVRLKVPEKEDIICHDFIRDLKNKTITVSSKEMDDKVLWKSSTGLPTYHLASVVDDHLMKISHVIRGDEWLASLPHHILLYRYFGWTPPIFVHTPVLLDPTGNGKLSKRKEYDFPVFPISYKGDDVDIKGFREEGFNREGFINFLMLNGWNPGNDLEIMTIHEITKLFSLERIKMSPSKFNWDKAKFINKKHIKKESNEKS